MKLNYKFIGDRRQPPIVFLHGFLGRGEDFEAIAQALVDRYCSVLVDLPGHGESLLADDRAYTMPATAQLIIDLLEQLELSPVNLYGYSMGGRLALYLALHDPKLCARALIESASPGCRTQMERQQRQQADRALADRLERMDTHGFANFLQHWYTQPLFKSLQQHASFAAIYKRRLQNNSIFLAKSLRAMGTGFQPSLWDALATHNQSLHFLAGEMDPKFCQLQTAILAIAPQATGSVIQQTGHNIHQENPAAVIREIARFFSGSHFYNCGT